MWNEVMKVRGFIDEDAQADACTKRVSKSIKEEGKTFAGCPGLEHRAYLKTHIIYKKLPELLQRIVDLEAKSAHIEKTNSANV